jgi:hypothetical protein
MRLDHIVWSVADLDAAQARVERELGVPVEAGRSHEGQGTHNRIVPLRGAYLELLAIRDREEAVASPVGALLVERIEAWLGPDHELPLRIIEGPPALRAIGIGAQTFSG